MPETGLRAIKELFPLLREPELLEEISKFGKSMHFKTGDVIMDYGSYVKFMPLVISGAIKVLRTDEDNDELFLYYLYPGQSCAMTLNCCTAQIPSEVRATAEEDTEILAVPFEKVREWLDKYRSWRDFVLATYSTRFLELLHTVDGIAFKNMDQRLMDYLLEKSRIAGNKTIHGTHNEIANDLHSSREVISRLLKQLEKQGKITLSRNKIELK